MEELWNVHKCPQMPAFLNYFIVLLLEHDSPFKKVTSTFISLSGKQLKKFCHVPRPILGDQHSFKEETVWTIEIRG
jgi:hypothetical protein